jgi:hypothetical protein
VSDLSELFDRDPLQLSDQDIARIVERMRQAQAQYELGAKPGAAPKAPKKSTATKAQDLLKELGL